MAVDLSARSPRTRVLRGVKQAILQGDFTRDEYLPSERIIASRLEVARGTVRAALDELVADGWIVVAGKRRRVQVPVASGAQSMIADVIGVLSTAPVQRDAEHQAPGWERHIAYGAMDRIRGASHHALWLDFERFAQPTQIAGGLPLVAGVVADRAVARSAVGLQLLQRWHALQVPVAVYDAGPAAAAFDSVHSDHAAGAAALTRWLIARGRTRILRVWQNERRHEPWLAERDRGFELAMHAAGLPVLPPLYVHYAGPNDDRRQELFEASVCLHAGYLLPYFQGPNPPDAIMCISDGEVSPAAAALRRLGREPQRDVLLVGYDNYWPDLFERQWEPTLPAATMDKTNTIIGATLVELLVARLQGELPAAPQRRLVPPQLVIPAL